MRLDDTSGRTFLTFCAVVEFSTMSQVPFGGGRGRFYSQKGVISTNTHSHAA